MADGFDDLDEELLQLTSKAPSTKRSRKSRKDEDISSESDVSLSDDDEPETKRSKGKSTPASRGESDDEGGGHDSDDLYENDEDRARLEAMNELEREMILADRAERADRERQKRQLLKQVRGKDGETAAEVRASSRRTKAQSGTDTAIAKLTAARERKEDLTRQKEEEEKEKKRSKRGGKGAASEDESSAGSEEDSEELVPEDEEEEAAEEEEEEEEEAPARNRSEQRRRDAYAPEYEEEEEGAEESEEASMEELLSIQVRRAKLERWLNEPFFQDTLPEVMVRVAQGEQVDPNTGRTVPYYLLMQVEGTKEGAPYKFGPGNTKTDVYLVARDGEDRKTVQMLLVSNQNFTETEYERWRRHSTRDNSEPVTKALVEKVLKKLHTAANYKYTHDDVKRRIEDKRQRGIIPTNLATEKARLLRLRDHAKQKTGDDFNKEEVESYDRQLAELEARILGEKGSGKRIGGMSDINKRNKHINFQKALNNVSNRPDGEKDRKGADPFSRRATRSIVYWNTKLYGSSQPDEEVVKEHIEAVLAPEKLDRAQQRMTPAALVRQLPLDIDILALQESAIPLLPRKLLGPKWAQSLNRHTGNDLAGKTLLSVSDWKRRAGIM